MRTHIVALIWECWRLSRRWYLWVLCAAIAGNLALLNGSPRRPPGAAELDAALVRELMAPGAFMLNFSLALMTTLLAITLGGKSGFPLSFEYRLPIRTSALVAVPMLYLATICASLHVIPLLVGRWIYGIPFPLLPGAGIFATLVVALLAGGWATTTTTVRTIVIFAVIAGSMKLFAWLDPLNLGAVRGRAPQPTDIHDILLLEPREYGVLVGLCLMLFGLTLASIQQQRKGEGPAAGLFALHSRNKRDDGETARNWTTALLDWAAHLFTPLCPTDAPWRAELWLELKRYAFPILVLSVLVALAVPVSFMFGITPATFTLLDYIFPLAVFFSGIGISIFNRRIASGGYMSAFEGTRGMSTTALSLIQLAGTAGSTFAGIAVVCISVHLSSHFLEEPGALARRLELVVTAFDTHGTLLLISEILSVLMFHAAVIAFFACVHVFSVVWGRLFLYGMIVAATYGLLFAFSVANGDAGLQEIKNQMWGLAACIAVLTLVALRKTLAPGIMSLRAIVGMTAVWILFAACSLYSLASRGIVIANQAGELQAMNAALLLLPFTLFALLLLGYDKLRHR